MAYFTSWIFNVTSQFIPETTTTTTSTKTTPGCTCLNENDAICLFYGKAFCFTNSFIGQVAFRDYCAKLCDNCPSTLCYDRQYCDFYAKFKNECYKLAKIKPHPCAKTCETC